MTRRPRARRNLGSGSIRELPSGRFQATTWIDARRVSTTLDARGGRSLARRAAPRRPQPSARRARSRVDDARRLRALVDRHARRRGRARALYVSQWDLPPGRSRCSRWRSSTPRPLVVSYASGRAALRASGPASGLLARSRDARDGGQRSAPELEPARDRGRPPQGRREAHARADAGARRRARGRGASPLSRVRPERGLHRDPVRELAGLTRDRLDLARRSAMLDRQTTTSPDGALRILVTPKAGSIRRITLPRALVSPLAEHLLAYPAGPNGEVFTDSTGKPLARHCSHFRRSWRAAACRSIEGVPDDFHVHQAPPYRSDAEGGRGRDAAGTDGGSRPLDRVGGAALSARHARDRERAQSTRSTRFSLLRR